MGFVYNTFTDLMFVWNARGGEGYSGFHVTGMIGDFFFWFEIFDSGIFQDIFFMGLIK